MDETTEMVLILIAEIVLVLTIVLVATFGWTTVVLITIAALVFGIVGANRKQ